MLQKFPVTHWHAKKPVSSQSVWCNISERSLLARHHGLLSFRWLENTLVILLISYVFYGFYHFLISLYSTDFHVFGRFNFLDTVLTFEILEIERRFSTREPFVFRSTFLLWDRSFLIFTIITSKIYFVTFGSWALSLTKRLTAECSW